MRALFPTFSLSQNCMLRAIHLDDAADYFRYINHPDVQPFVPNNCLPGDLKKAQTDLQFLYQLFEQKRGIYWTIARQDNQQMIGSCGFETWHRTHARLELVYDLDPAYWGSGIMLDALQHIIQFAFAYMPVNRIEAVTTADNTRSQRILDKCQFTQEALLQQYRYFKHNFTDVYMYALLRQQYKPTITTIAEQPELKRFFYA